MVLFSDRLGIHLVLSVDNFHSGFMRLLGSTRKGIWAMKMAGVPFIIFFSNVILCAQNIDSCHHVLKGVILDAETKKAIPYVQVGVKGSQTFSLTDTNGTFSIEHLCQEMNTLIISCFGYCDTTCTNYHQHGKTPHIYLQQKTISLDEVTITVEKGAEDGTVSISQQTVNKSALALNPGQTLAAAISGVEGVTLMSTGSNVQLPVIHGLYGNRVLLLNNGIKHGFQNWSSDHAPEIDVSVANRITVVKGAAGVRYGPEALGGAIIVESDPLYLEEPLKVKIGTGYQTNGRGYFIQSELGQGLANWSYHLGVNYARIGDRNTPDYSLTNSGKVERSLNVGLRYRLENWDFKSYYSVVHQNLALLRSSVGESANAFRKAINSDEPTIVRPFSYQISEPNQLTTHHLGKIEANWWYADDAKLTLVLGSQLNKREEYDVRRNADKPIIDLDLMTNDVQLNWKHPDWLKLDGLMGIQAFFQNNDNNPGTGTTPFIPNYNTMRYSGFVVESLKDAGNTYEAGIRLDYERNQVSGRETNQDIFRDKYQFTNVTTSLGYVRRISDNSTFRTNLGAAWRTPNMAELFSFGQHGFKLTYGLLRYYVNESGGYSNAVILMKESEVFPEKGYKWTTTWDVDQHANHYSLTVYGNYIENYLYERPIGVFGTIRGPMPGFVFDQADAAFAGADWSWQRDWSNSIAGTLGVSYLWSRNLKKNEPLINQPPVKVNYDLKLKLMDFWMLTSSHITLKPSYTFRQYQAPRTVTIENLEDGSQMVTSSSEIFDFMDAPSGYFLLDAAWNFQYGSFDASLSIHNAMSTRYRNYLNHMRYFADEVGRNFLITINYTF